MMTDDRAMGLKIGGLAAWKRFKNSQSSEFRRRYNNRHVEYKLNFLDAWADRTGWSAKSNLPPPSRNKEHIQNGLFENRYLLGEKSPFNDLVSPQDTYQHIDSRKVPSPDFSRSDWRKSPDARLAEFNQDTLVKFEHNPRHNPALSVGLCPKNTVCAVDATVDPISGEITRMRHSPSMDYDCNPLSYNPLCQVSEQDWNQGSQWGAVRGLHEYANWLNDCRSVSYSPSFLNACKKVIFGRLKRHYGNHISQNALDYIKGLK